MPNFAVQKINTRLENLLKLNPKIIIPSHGGVMRDESYIKLMIRLLQSIKLPCEASLQKDETLEQMRKGINLEEFRKLFAGGSQHKSFIFLNYVFFARNRRIQAINGKKSKLKKLCKKQLKILKI